VFNLRQFLYYNPKLSILAKQGTTLFEIQKLLVYGASEAFFNFKCDYYLKVSGLLKRNFLHATKWLMRFN